MIFRAVTIAVVLALGSATPNEDEFRHPDIHVTAGRSFSLLVDAHHKAWAVGRNSYGQLGVGEETEGVRVATEVEGLPEGLTMTAAGAFHSLFLTESGRVFAAGRNKYGECGADTSGNDVSTPQEITFPGQQHAVAHVAAGYAHSVFVLVNGDVYTAGYNSAGQLGDGTLVSKPLTKLDLAYLAPGDGRRLEALGEGGGDGGDANFQTEFVGAAAGYDTTYLLQSDGKVFAVGQNLAGQLGDGTTRSKTSFVQVQMDEADFVMKVVAGHSHALFRTRDNKVYGTGSNFDGQLGRGSEELMVKTPQDLNLVGVTNVAAGGDSSFITVSSQVWAMGSNRDGQLGKLYGPPGSAPPTLHEPQLMNVPPEVASMAIGDHHSLMGYVNDVMATGLNSHGELGLDHTDDQLAFQRVTQTWETYVPPPTEWPPSDGGHGDDGHGDDGHGDDGHGDDGGNITPLEPLEVNFPLIDFWLPASGSVLILGILALCNFWCFSADAKHKLETQAQEQNPKEKILASATSGTEMA